MSRSRYDTINLMRRGDVARPRRRARIVLPFLVFAAVGLLLWSRLEHSVIGDVRWRIAAFISPVFEAAMMPLQPIRRLGRYVAEQVDRGEELDRLRTENQKLSQWEWRARELERKLIDLEALSKVVAAPQLGFVTSRVIGDLSGAFVRSVLIDGGRGKGIKSGLPVINADGLVGRVVEVGVSSARVLLVNDRNSRIPVVIGAAQMRAVLAGDSGPLPRLMDIPPGAVIRPGDEVSTSATGGAFPRGLRIGRVADGGGGEPRVAVRAHLDSLDYVSVLFFEDASARIVDGGASSPGGVGAAGDGGGDADADAGRDGPRARGAAGIAASEARP